MLTNKLYNYIANQKARVLVIVKGRVRVRGRSKVVLACMYKTYFS